MSVSLSSDGAAHDTVSLRSDGAAGHPLPCPGEHLQLCHSQRAQGEIERMGSARARSQQNIAWARDLVRRLCARFFKFLVVFSLFIFLT